MVHFRQFLMCLILYINVLTENIAAYSYENVTQLKTTLLAGYDPDVIPLNNQTDALNVTIRMTLFQILEMDTVAGVLTSTIGLECYWFDERIQWTPDDYGGITSLMILSNNIWTPPLAPGHPVEFSTFGESWMHVTFQSNGSALWRPGGVEKSSCDMNMKYWPFDEQTCVISFYPYDYWTGEIRFNVDEISTQYYYENSEWTLKETDATTRTIDGVEGALFRITIERRPAYYMLTLTLPLGGLWLMTSFVFLLPSESGERLSFAITILLALTVFLTIISDNIPKSSNPVPLACVFVFTSVFASKLATIMVILNVAIYHRSCDKKIGTWYVTLVKFTRRRSIKVDDLTTVIEAGKPERENGFTFGNRDGTLQENPEMTTEKIACTCNGHNSNEQKNKDLDITWKEVSRAIDTTMFVCFIVFQVLVFIIWGSLVIPE